MSPEEKYYKLTAHLNAVMDRDPVEAIKQAREIECGLETSLRINLMNLRAAILVDAGALAKQQDAIEEGIALLRELHRHSPVASITYNLANGLVESVGYPPMDGGWLDHQERTRTLRAEARACFWKVAQDPTTDVALRTQVWTNLANQLSNSIRLGEAHDAWLAALEMDPTNGVAASAAARNLLWLYNQGGCSDLTRAAAITLGNIAHRNQDRVAKYVGRQASEKIAAFARELGDPPPQTSHSDPFIRWVERERLTLAPAVELIDPAQKSSTGLCSLELWSAYASRVRMLRLRHYRNADAREIFQGASGGPDAPGIRSDATLGGFKVITGVVSWRATTCDGGLHGDGQGEQEKDQFEHGPVWVVIPHRPHP